MPFSFAFLLAILLPVLCLGPGFFFIRRLKWGDNEKLVASIGLSIILIYLAATAIYLLRISWAWCWLASTGGIVLSACVGSDLARLLARRSVRRQIAGFGFLLAIGLLMLSLIHHYSGGEWSGDWIEHYERSKFFLDRWPIETLLIERYSLSARPPLMNLVAAYFLAQAGHGYDLFQLVFLFLNLLVFFSCALLANMLVKHGARKTWLLAIFLALNPMLWENATWTWTKLLTGFFVLLSLALYLRGWRKNDPTRMIGAAVSMAGALLVHYSAGPYAVALFVHYLALCLTRSRKWQEIAFSAGASSALLATWFGWSLLFFGPRTTFASNTTAMDTQKLSVGENLAKIGSNAVNTFVPHPLILPHRIFHLRLSQPNPFGLVRDFFFLIYQTNLTLAWGLIAWIPLGWLMVWQLAHAPPPIRRFWIVFLTIGVVLGIAVVGTREEFGVAHACLQPIVLIGLTLLAGGFLLLPRWARCALVSAAVVDLVLGIVLQIRLQMQAFHLVPGPGAPIVPLNDGLLSIAAVRNSVLRYGQGLAYWSDHFNPISWIIHIALIAAFGLAVLWLATAAMRSGNEPLGKARSFGFSMMLLFLAGAAISSMDRALGYDGSRLNRPPPPASIDSMRRAVAASPDSARAHYELGLTYYNFGLVDAATDAWLDAFLLDPFDPKTRHEFGLLLGTHGRMPGSGPAAVPEAMIEHPDNVSAQLAMVKMLANRKHQLPALKQLRATARQHPDSPQVQLTLEQLDADLPALDLKIRELEALQR